MDKELETWTEKIMDEQQYRSGIFTDLKSLLTRLTGKRASRKVSVNGE